MIEAKYFKDYNHNYMILKCEDTGKGENYRRSMLSHNKIEGLLKCSVRNVNGAAYFYYDISSKVTLGNLYHGKKMSYGQVRDFFIRMDMICRNLGQFFMEESGLLLQPDCIFYDFTSKTYFGLYYPTEAAQDENPYEPLTDFLLNHTDTGDRKLADIIYQIYELSENRSFSIADALTFFDEAEAVPDAAMTVSHGYVPGEMGYDEEREIGAGETGIKETGIKEIGIEGIGIEETGIREMPKTKTETAAKTEEGDGTYIPSDLRKNRIYYTVLAVISLCGTGAVLWIYNNYILTQQELMMTVCCMAVMGLCLIFSVAQVILSGKRMGDMAQEERRLLKDIGDEFRDGEDVALGDVLDKSMNAGIYGEPSMGGMAEQDSALQANGRERRKKQPEYAQEEWHGSYTETVFMDARKQDAEYKLYALDNRNKMHIELTRFPFTIGKMAGCVDCVLADGSVSRLHARIEKQGGKIFLTDMNSTNGTYKNGLRMQPDETVEIEPGDEIRFGKLNYCYR